CRHTAINSTSTQIAQKVRSATGSTRGDKDLAVNVVNRFRERVGGTKQETICESPFESCLQRMVTRVTAVGARLHCTKTGMNTRVPGREYIARIQLFVDEEVNTARPYVRDISHHLPGKLPLNAEIPNIRFRVVQIWQNR